MREMIITATLLLAACGGGERPEPQIRTVEVQVPVPVPCDAAGRLGPAPAYPDTDEALRAAADIFAQTQLLLAGRALRIARLDGAEAALRTCAR